jgi:hypothetical protein
VTNWFVNANGKLIPGRTVSVAATAGTLVAVIAATWMYQGPYDAIPSPTDLTATATNRASLTLEWTQPRTLKSRPVEHNLIRAWGSSHRFGCQKRQKLDAGTYSKSCILATDAGAVSCYRSDAGARISCDYEKENPDAGVIPLPDGGMAKVFNTDAIITFCWCNRGKADEKIPPSYPYEVFPCTVGAACAP